MIVVPLGTEPVPPGISDCRMVPYTPPESTIVLGLGLDVTVPFELLTT
ncbi:Uncharacterised protein [Mycobacterium tuberculosis]|nr:Uncharacterised protein [Mycobacterium tuberculosis]